MQIYQILNKVTGKSYIGKSKDYISRFEKHKKLAKLKINRRLYDSINHHGIENFELNLIEDLGNCSANVANEKEIFWIKEFNSLIPFGYNMTTGGDGGNTLESKTDEEKQEIWAKQARKRIGLKRGEETRKIMSESSKIREASKTEEDKIEISKQISNTLKRKYESGELVATTPIFFGVEHPSWVDVNIEEVLYFIKNCKTLKYICEVLTVSPYAVRTRLMESTGKNFIEWRREYGITGRLSNPRN